MFSRSFQETRVGRIPTGYAAYEAEAVQLEPKQVPVTTQEAQDIGELTLVAIFQEEAPEDQLSDN